MKSKIIKNKKKIVIGFLWLVLSIIFFNGQLLFSWDSTVYLGMSLVLGTSNIKDVWLPVRGISFPLLLRFFEPFGYQNKYLLLLMFYIFYMVLLYVIYKIGQKLSLYKNEYEKVFYIFFIILFIILNPYVFTYYHTVLTEFVAMTLNMLFVYLVYNYIRYDFRKDKKILILYGLILSLIVVFLYHTKQSFVGMMLIEFALGIILSFFRFFDLKNILFRVLNIMFCGLLLFASVKLWHISMNNVGLNHTTEVATESLSNNKIVKGITKLKVAGNSKKMIYSDGKFVNTVIVISENSKRKNEINISNEKTKKEMIKVLNKESKYKEFTVYEDINNSNIQYVSFTKDDYGLLEQLPLYFKIFATHPNIVISSYIDGLYKTVWVEGYWTHENKVFALDYFHFSDTNISDIAPGYEFAVKDLEESSIPSLFDNFEFGLTMMFYPIYRANQMIVPILFLISFIILIYIIIKSKKNNSLDILRNGFEMITLLYGMAFACELSYIMFGAFLDRYLSPSIIPMFVGDIIFIIYIVKSIKLKKALN